MATGILRIQSFAARESAPMPGVSVTVTSGDFTDSRVTDDAGSTADIQIEAPACSYSLDENNTTVRPYAVCSLVAQKAGYRTITIEGIQIFSGQVTLAPLEMIPENARVEEPDEPVVIPPHPLFAGGGGSGPAPAADPRVLPAVVIPKSITVHLGTPSSSAKNVTVSFRDYIANVASSEVYPTWAEQNKPTTFFVECPPFWKFHSMVTACPPVWGFFGETTTRCTKSTTSSRVKTGPPASCRTRCMVSSIWPLSFSCSPGSVSKVNSPKPGTLLDLDSPKTSEQSCRNPYSGPPQPQEGIMTGAAGGFYWNRFL